MLRDMLMPYRRFIDLTGRASRRQYWLFIVFLALSLFATLAIGETLFQPGMLTGASHARPHPTIVLLYLWGAVNVVPLTTLTVRRIHDSNLTGWLYVIAFIPYVGAALLFVLMLLPGTDGPNRFGPDPAAGQRFRPDGGGDARGDARDADPLGMPPRAR